MLQQLRKNIAIEVLEEYDAITGFELLLGSNAIIAYNDFIEVITRDNYALLDIKSIPHVKMTKLLALIFPDRIPKLHTKIFKYILSLRNLRECKKCNSIQPEDNFRPNSSKSDGYNCQCKKCQSAGTALTQPKRQAAYKSAKLDRTPSWADQDKIIEIYNKCPDGYHVDHIVPLQGENVSGLHVEYNLQYLTAEENLKKHNKFIAG